MTCLDPSDRLYLGQFLPKEGAQKASIGAAKESDGLGGGHPSSGFGDGDGEDPLLLDAMVKFHRGILSGMFHPEVVKYRATLADLEQTFFFHRLR